MIKANFSFQIFFFNFTETALDTQRKFESINVGFSAENLREPPGNTPQQVESDNADELMPIQ